MRYVFTLTSILIIQSFGFSQNDCKPNTFPFQVNESLNYDIYYNWKAIWMHAGEVTFSLHDTLLRKTKVLYALGDGHTYKKYDWIYKVRDKYESWMRPSDLKPYRFKRNVREGPTHIYNDYIFNQKKRKAYTFSRNQDEALIADTANISPCVFDPLSMIYYARTLDFTGKKIGDTLPISIFIDEMEHDSFIRYLGKETITTKSKESFKCIKFKPLLIAGTIFKGGEGMTVWVTDDKNRIPVHIETPILVGSIKASLVSYKGVKFPLKSKIE